MKPLLVAVAKTGLALSLLMLVATAVLSWLGP